MQRDELGLGFMTADYQATLHKATRLAKSEFLLYTQHAKYHYLKNLITTRNSFVN